MPNLLQKASILLTPTAYDDGKVLCAKPSEPPYGDFDFSRNSAATRVNAQGLVENVQILSGNLVQNGDFSEEGAEEVSNGSFSQEGAELVSNGSFDTGSDWSLGTGWTISGGKANATSSPSGQRLSQFNLGQTINRPYKINLNVSNLTEGGFRVWFGGVQSQAISSDGDYTIYLTPTSTAQLFIFTNGTTTGSIDNVSIREVGQDWTFGTGWSVGDGVAISDGSNGYSFLQQTGAVENGKSYKLTYSVTNYVSGTIEVGVGGASNNNIQRNSVGDFVEYHTSNGTNLTVISRNFNGSITNISVKEVGQNWDLLNGTITDKYNASLTSYQNGIRVNPFTYTGTVKVTFDLVVTSGSCKFVAGGSNEQIYSTSGTKEIIVTNPSRFEFNAFNLGWVGTLDNVSAIQITDDTNLPRINYEGFSYQDALGSEEIVNGDFSNGSTGWSVGANSEINNGSARIYSPSGSYTFVSQSNVLTVGKTYLISLEIVEQNLGEIRLSDGVGYLSNSFSGVGVHTFKSTSIGTIFRIQRTASITDIRIDNVSVKEVLGQEVVPDSGCGSWLFEPQSTNLIDYSSDYTNGWINTGTTDVISSTMLSPNGLDYSTLLVGDVATASTKRIRNTVTPIASTAHTFSVFVKSANRTYIQIINSGDAQGYANFDVSNGIVGNTGSKTTANITPLNNNWYRCEVSTDATTNNGGFMIYLVDSNTASFAASGTSTDGVYIWGAQLEVGNISSYIPTEGTSVTRNQDVCNNGGSLASINSTEGVLYFEGSALVGGSNTQISLSDGTNDNGVKLRFDLSPDRLTIFLRGNSGTIAIRTIISVTQTDNNKIALVWDITNFRIWLNGVEAGTIATNDLPVGLDTLNFANNTGIANFYGKTKAVAVWKEALSDEELTELTTI